MDTDFRHICRMIAPFGNTETASEGPDAPPMAKAQSHPKIRSDGLFF